MDVCHAMDIEDRALIGRIPQRVRKAHEGMGDDFRRSDHFRNPTYIEARILNACRFFEPPLAKSSEAKHRKGHALQESRHSEPLLICDLRLNHRSSALPFLPVQTI